MIQAFLSSYCFVIFSPLCSCEESPPPPSSPPSPHQYSPSTHHLQSSLLLYLFYHAIPSLEFHSLLSVEFDPDCLARKQRGMFVLRRPQMMKMLRFFCFWIMLKFYKLASCNLSSGSVLKSSQNYVLLLSPLGRLNDHSFTLPKFSISREQINCNILKFSSRSSPFFQVVIVLFA